MTTEKILSQTLTGTGTTDEATVASYRNILFQYTVTGISGTVVVLAEGSNDGSNWFNIDENGATSITTDGTGALQLSNTALEQVRFNWSSGSATSIEVDINGNR